MGRRLSLRKKVEWVLNWLLCPTLRPGRTGGWLQMNRMSSRNNRLNFKTPGNLPIILEESMECTSNEWKQNRKMSKCNRLEIESLNLDRLCPKTSQALTPTSPLLPGCETCDYYKIEVVATFLIIFGAHTNILFIIKVKILVFITWSCNRSLQLSGLLSQERLSCFEHVVQTLLYASFWYPYLAPHPTTYHSNIGVSIRYATGWV